MSTGKWSFQNTGFSFGGKEGNSLLEFLDNVLGHTVEGGIFVHIKKRSLDK
jgi:hypothetical protein